MTITDENTIDLGNDFALDDLSFGTNALVVPSIYTAVEIDWNSTNNVNYQVQYATSLDTNNWLNLGNPVAGNGTTNVVFDTMRGQTKKFYRVEIAP